MRRASAPLSLAIALALVGCGGDEGQTAPASVVPAGAPVYVDFSVRPEGEAADDAEAAAARILGEDPGGQIVELVQGATGADGESLDYEEDVEPWLGEKFAVFLTAIGGGETQSRGAYVVETTDVDRALEALGSSSEPSGRTREHQGVTYELDDGEVIGAVDDFIVGGDEAAFKAAVEAAEGDSLAESEQFEQAVDELAEDRLATLYVPPARLIKSIKDPGLSGQQRKLLQRALGGAAKEPVTGELTASGDAITLELSSGAGSVDTAESRLLPKLPRDAWLAIGLGDLGGAVASAVEQIDRAGVGGIDAEAVRSELLDRTGVELEREVIEALGDAALFVSGTSSGSLGGAVVIESNDLEASAELIGKLEDLVALEVPAGIRVEPLASTDGDQGFQVSDPRGGLQQGILVIQQGKRIVAGYGGAAVNQALAGTAGADPLSSDPAFERATEALGELGVDAFVSLESAIALVREGGVGAAPRIEQIGSFLDTLDFLVVGTGSEDDRALLRLVIGLQGRSGSEGAEETAETTEGDGGG